MSYAPEVKSRAVTVTPRMAERWLAEGEAHAEALGLPNGNPRGHTNQQTVNNYARQLETGQWLDGSAMHVNEEGLLINGWHRSKAIILSGVPMNVILITGVEIGMADVVDTGPVRSLQQRLNARGEKNTIRLAGAISLIMHLEFNGSVRSHVKINNNDALPWLDSDPYIRDSLAEALRIYNRNKDFNVSVLTAVLYGARVAANDPDFDVTIEDVEKFETDLRENEGLVNGDPTKALLNWVKGAKQTGKKPVQAHVYGIYMKAWNDYIIGNSREQLTFRSGGANPEPEPRLRDGNGDIVWPPVV